MSRILTSSFAAESWPRAVAGIEIPRNPLSALGIETARACSPEFLINHCARTFLFGCVLGELDGLRVDYDIFFLACMMHDLGLTNSYMGELPFEIQGAEAARKVLLNHGYPAALAEIVWDGIAMHTLAIADFKAPEIRLVSSGAAADVTGHGLSAISKEQVQEVLNAFPRLDFKNRFIEDCALVAHRYPAAATRSFIRDIADRTLSEFNPANICDRIKVAPFEE